MKKEGMIGVGTNYHHFFSWNLNGDGQNEGKNFFISHNK